VYFKTNIRFLLLFILVITKIQSQNNNLSKKGVAFSLNYENSWHERFDKLNPAWHYSWNWEYRDHYPNNVEFVPMIWGSDAATQEKIDYLNNLANPILDFFDEKFNLLIVFFKISNTSERYKEYEYVLKKNINGLVTNTRKWFVVFRVRNMLRKT